VYFTPVGGLEISNFHIFLGKIRSQVPQFKLSTGFMEILFNDTSTEITSDHHHVATIILAPEDSSTQPTVTSTDIEMSLSNLQLCSVTQNINDHDSSPTISPSSSFGHDADFFTPMIASKTELNTNISKLPQSKTENFPSEYTPPSLKHFSKIPSDVKQPSKWRQHTQ
jgi:hypothetical protein